MIKIHSKSMKYLVSKILNKFKINYSLFIFLILMLYLSKYQEIIVIISSIIMHELAHVFVAYLFGYKNFRIELSMFGGMCYLNINNKKKLSALIIYSAGIIMNLCIILISMLYDNELSKVYMHYNLIMLIFSVLPIYPLDGYRILSIFFRNKMIIISITSIIILLVSNIYFKSIGLLILCLFLILKNFKIKEDITNQKIREIIYINS